MGAEKIHARAAALRRLVSARSSIVGPARRTRSACAVGVSLARSAFGACAGGS